jgi:hypothetical protein
MEEKNTQTSPPPEINPPPRPPHRKLGPILWPLLLIGVGILLLFNTLGLLQQSVWEILWSLWPVIFIAIGLDSLFRKKEIFGPVFWFGLGGVFLLTNFGILGWEAWNALFRLWPLLLVTAGLDILLGRRSLWISLPVTVIVLSILAVALGLTGIRLPSSSTEETAINEPIGSAKQADVSIGMGVGDLNLFPLKDSNALITGEISSEGAAVRVRSTQDGDTLVYTIEHQNPVMFIPFDEAWSWNLGLTTQIPIELDSSMGVGSMGLVLDEMKVTDLNVSQGVGEVEVILPDGDYRSEIDQAIGQIVIEIPRDIPIHLEVSRAISSLSLPSDFVQQGDFYLSPEAQEVSESIQIKINQAIGTIIVRYIR